MRLLVAILAATQVSDVRRLNYEFNELSVVVPLSKFESHGPPDEPPVMLQGSLT